MNGTLADRVFLIRLSHILQNQTFVALPTALSVADYACFYLASFTFVCFFDPASSLELLQGLQRLRERGSLVFVHAVHRGCCLRRSLRASHRLQLRRDQHPHAHSSPRGGEEARQKGRQGRNSQGKGGSPRGSRRGGCGRDQQAGHPRGSHHPRVEPSGIREVPR